MSDYEKLKKIIDDIPQLISAGIPSWDPKFQAWKTIAERFLARKFGKDSIEYERFVKTSFSLGFFTSSTSNLEFVRACQAGLRTCEATFRAYLEEMEEDSADNDNSPKQLAALFERVFLVHGHDGELKEAVARIIEKQGINPIILSEKANQGRTIIEKFENYSDVGGAICLFTADDIGKEKTGADEKPRARQNVVFEAGYFMGKLGRDHIVILADKGVEMPSDLSGVVYTDTSSWQVDLLKELKAMGYKVDFNKLF